MDYKICHTGLLGKLNEIAWYIPSIWKYTTRDGEGRLIKSLCFFCIWLDMYDEFIVL